jgi:uncharacterized protein (DUF2141 family)
MSAEQSKNEKKRIKYAFECAVGDLVWGRRERAEASGEETIDISDLNHDLLLRFFTSGWKWGKTERPAICPTCCSATVPEEETD